MALDRWGNGVIIELKRDSGQLGVETQALQYLVDFQRYRGQAFIDNFSGKNPSLGESVQGFLEAGVEIEDINKNARIILLARSFDETLFSMGEWISSKGVAFRCVSYSAYKIGADKFLSFSVQFDRSDASLFKISSTSSLRSPGYFWHNIGRADQNWWTYLVEQGEISTSFTNMAGGPGEIILRKYVTGDIIIAYAGSYGAIGVAEVTGASKYHLIEKGSEEDKFEGDSLHRLGVKWLAHAPNIGDGIKANKIREQFELFHPISTSVSVDAKKGEKLVKELIKMFPKKP